MGKKTTSRATFEIVVGSRSETFEVRDHKFVGTLCAGLLSRLGFGRDLSDWELREATGEVVPFDRTEHQAGIAARRHYYLIRVADKPQKGGQPDHKKGTRRRSRR